MKKVIIPFLTLFAYAATTMAENDKMYFWLKDGSVVEYAISDVDSLTFSEQEQITPEVSPAETMQKLRDDLVQFAPDVPNNSYGEVAHVVNQNRVGKLADTLDTALALLKSGGVPG